MGMPVKIVTHLSLLRNLKNENYIDQIEYLHVIFISNFEECERDWNRHQEIFDQCTNLKEIEFQGVNAEEDIWQERISYFENRGIRLAKKGAIRRNNDLKLKL